MEVQRYPGDYDGVLAASALVDRASTWATWAWIAQAFAKEGAQIPHSALPVIQTAVIQSCDTLDGLEDGIISDPTRCRFDPEVLVCKGADLSGCLTQPQVTALTKYYAGPRTSSGEQVFPSFSPGAEACLDLSMTCEGSAERRASAWVDGLLSPRWNVPTFNFDRDVHELAADPDVKEGSAIDPNLKMFMNRGGKLIVEHGWSDGTTVPMVTVDYFKRVVSTMGSKAVESFLRLYMVPGMAHSGAPGLPNAPTGSGLNRFHALQQWVEKGTPPRAVVATKYRIDGDPASGVVRTRPLCPYPQAAVYKGHGSADDAKNFSCKLQ
jgi:feruloyl esterase